MKKDVLKNFAILAGKHLCWSFLNKVAGLKDWTFIKKKTQVFSCEYSVTFKNIYFEEHLRTAAFEREALIFY